MTWDNVPWFVGGGAQHSPEVARLFAYAATSGVQGVVAPGDLTVTTLAVPGSSIRVLSGAALILSRYAGGEQQTYVARNPSEDVKGVSATGSGSGRNDLVIAQIKDPFLPDSPHPDPADPTVGPYVFTEIIPNVSSADIANHAAAAAYLRANGITGIPLAALILPANTGTVTSDMIRNLRKLASPRSERFLDSQQHTTANLNLSPAESDPEWYRWPGFEPSVEIPAWATDFRQIITISNVRQFSEPTSGQFRAMLGTVGGAAPVFNYEAGNATGAPGVTRTLIASNGGDCRAMAGTVVKSWAEGIVTTGGLFVASGTDVVHDIQFFERTV